NVSSCASSILRGPTSTEHSACARSARRRRRSASSWTPHGPARSRRASRSRQPRRVYVLIAGGGKIGANLARSLLRDGHGHEVTLIEQRRDRYERLEHDVHEHELLHLLELRKENLEIVEVQIDKSAPAAGKRVEKLKLPEGSRLISITRNGRSEIAIGSTELQPGDQVLAILQPGKEDELRRVLLKN